MKITMNLAEQQSIIKLWTILQEISEQVLLLENDDAYIELPKIPRGIYLQKWLDILGEDITEETIIDERALLINALCRREVIDFEEELSSAIRFIKTSKFNKFCKEIESKYNAIPKDYKIKITAKMPLRDEKGNNLITRDRYGDYHFNEKKVVMNKETTYYQIFDILFLEGEQNGFLSYEEIEKALTKRGYPESKTDESRNKRINNAIFNKQQGLFRFAKINSKRLENKLPNGQQLIELIRGKGLKINNPRV